MVLRVAGEMDLEVPDHCDAVVAALEGVLEGVREEREATDVVVCVRRADGSLSVTRYARPDEAVGILERAKLWIALGEDE